MIFEKTHWSLEAGWAANLLLTSIIAPFVFTEPFRVGLPSWQDFTAKSDFFHVPNGLLLLLLFAFGVVHGWNANERRIKQKMSPHV